MPLVLKPKFSERYESLHKAYAELYRQGGWTVVVDELFAQCELGLTRDIEMLATEGRGNAITLVACQQRLSRTTRFAVGESSHVLTAPLEGRDIMIFRDIASDDAAYYASQLEQHQFVWFRRPNRIAIVKLNMDTDQLEWEIVS